MADNTFILPELCAKVKASFEHLPDVRFALYNILSKVHEKLTESENNSVVKSRFLEKEMI